MGAILFLGKYLMVFLGPKWVGVLPVAKLLLISSCVNLVVSPLSIVLVLLDKNAINIIWQDAFFVSLLGVCFVNRSASLHTFVYGIVFCRIVLDIIRYIVIFFLILFNCLVF